ncbi:MAG TPA: response regulator [Allocoleopsis sp.]
MKTILLIEDNKFPHSKFCQLLLTRGYQVISAENGWMGLDMAIELQPDLIISDMNTPCLSGDEVLKILRANFKTAHIPFIFLTSETNSNRRSSALKLGANAYLTKPLKTSDLFNTIAAQLQEHQFSCPKAV